MRILFIGGTRFVGRAMATAAVDAGHDITLLHRGQTGRETFADAEHLLADRDEDLGVLAGREFDATVDVCAYLPRQVRSLAEALGGRGGHHVFVSTMSVYADTDEPGLDEGAPLVRLSDHATEEVTGETYGGLKVLCEEQAKSSYDKSDLTIVRPTYVVGPHDHTGRFTWWVRRIARGGEVLAPGPHDSPIQVIDARDLATWTISLAEDAKHGAFNAISPTPPFGFGDLLDATVRAVGPHETVLTWADPGWLSEQGEDYKSLPLWTEGEAEWTLAADPTKAIAAGLSPRPLTETVSDTWDWIKDEQPPLVTGWGVSTEREAELLTGWHGRHPTTPLG
ncbi:MAG: NAD-dependent epimerase/dehydratase family protein [Nocardioidaceae bacterium]|nr:NAD-dependent epimerase/dehydratase family protein [Nocardioidaceae bacterium]